MQNASGLVVVVLLRRTDSRPSADGWSKRRSAAAASKNIRKGTVSPIYIFIIQFEFKVTETKLKKFQVTYFIKSVTKHVVT